MSSGRWMFWAALGCLSLYQLFLISNGTMALFAPEQLDGTFDSMLQHLLAGDAGVSREAIGYESFTVNGRAIAYFGIMPALLRLPALMFLSDPEAMHLGRLSCLLADTIFVGLTLRTVLIVHESLCPKQRDPLLLVVVSVSIALSGGAIFAMVAGYVYSEPVLWGAVFVAWFNLIVVRATLARGVLSGPDLVWLAALAGLAVNTRGTSGIALIGGYGLIALWLLLRRSPIPWGALFVSGGVMVSGIVIAGLVNMDRWGNPLVFADFLKQDIVLRYPDRLARMTLLGAFSVARIPYSLLYYTTGLPYILKFHGEFGAVVRSLYDSLEGAPSTPVLTGPLWICLMVLGLRRRFLTMPLVAAALVGQLLASFALLMAMAVTLRYRLDLAGLVELPAVYGYAVLSRWLAKRRHAWRQVRMGCVVLAAVGVFGAHFVLLMTKVLSPGLPVEVRCALQRAVPFVPVNTTTYHVAGCWGMPS